MDQKNYTESEIRSVMNQCYEEPLVKDMLEAMLMNERRTLAKMRIQCRTIKKEIEQKVREYLSLSKEERVPWLGLQNRVSIEPTEEEIDQEELSLIADENAKIDARINARR